MTEKELNILWVERTLQNMYNDLRDKGYQPHQAKRVITAAYKRVMK